MLIADAPGRRPHRGGGDGTGEQRELPGRQPRAAARARARTCSPSMASRAWSTSSETPATALRNDPERARELGGARLAGGGARSGATDPLDTAPDRAPAARAAGSDDRASAGCAREPFARLIEANRIDQRVHRYETWEQLRGYCALSADPVGELVLGVFGLATPERVALSDSICTALQLAEHCQDVAEDLAPRARVPAGRGSRPLRLHARRSSRPSTPAGRCARCSPSRSPARAVCSTRARR